MMVIRGVVWFCGKGAIIFFFDHVDLIVVKTDLMRGHAEKYQSAEAL